MDTLVHILRLHASSHSEVLRKKLLKTNINVLSNNF